MSTERLREDVERTRSELGDTVEALADKVDVKSRMKRRAAGIRESVTWDRMSTAARRGAPAVIAVAATLPVAVWWWRRRAKR